MVENTSKKLSKKTGLIIGKFMPIHKGHMYLINEAKKKVDHLTVLVCSLNQEPILGVLRYNWVKELYPDINVQHLTDENPSYPEDDPDFWNIWVKSISKFCDEKIDYVFTSENYGEELARRLDSKHVLIDLKRKTFPVSGTDVRKDPYKNWEYLPLPVRAFYTKRIVIIGAESSGKTTLSLKLAEHYSTECLLEYGREYIDKKQAAPELSDIPKIALEHLKREDDLARKSNKILICDTDMIVTSVLSDYYFKTCPQWVLDASYSRKYDLHILCDTDIPWEADPIQREGEEVRSMLHNRFKEELEKRNTRYVLVSGSVNERLEKAVKHINNLFSAQNTLSH